MWPPVFTDYIFYFEQDFTHPVFSFISFVYLKFGVLLPSSKNIHYTLYLTSNMRMYVA